MAERKSEGKASSSLDAQAKDRASKGNGRRVRPALGTPVNRLPPGRREDPATDPAFTVKTTLSHEELDGFRHLLLEKRAQLVGDMSTMANEALRKNRTDAAGDLSMMPIHMADIGTDAYEQEFTIGLIESEKQILKEIDAALERIRAGTYGVCEATRKPITKIRLKAKPWARFCVAYERAQEQSERGRK